MIFIRRAILGIGKRIRSRRRRRKGSGGRRSSRKSGGTQAKPGSGGAEVEADGVEAAKAEKGRTPEEVEGETPIPNPGTTAGPERETGGGTPGAEGKEEVEGAESGKAKPGGAGG